MNTDYLANLRVADIAISPSDPDIIHIAGSVFYAPRESFGEVNHLSTMSIYVTYDGGQNWSLTGAPFDFQLATNPNNTDSPGNNLYDMEYVTDRHTTAHTLLAVSDLGIHRTFSYGSTWQHMWASVPTNYTKGPRKIRVAPSQTNHVYLGGEVRYDDFTQGFESDDIYRSPDNGTSFSIWKTIEKLGTSPANDNDLNLRLSVKGKIFNLLIIRHDVLISHQDPNKVYVVVKVRNEGSDYGMPGKDTWKRKEHRYWLFVTTDGGNTWTTLQRGDKIILKYAAYKAWNINPLDDDILYIGTANGGCDTLLRRSIDGGYTFAKFGGEDAELYNDGHIHPDIRAIVFPHPLTNKEPRMLMGTDGGMNISRAPRDPINPDIKNITGRGLGIMQSFRVACGETSDISILSGAIDIGTNERTSLNGPWDRVLTGDGMDCKIDFTDHTTRYASLQRGYFNRHEAGVINGIDINPPGTRGLGEWVTPIEMSYLDAETIYLGFKQLWKSEDRGDSWIAISNVNSENITYIAAAPSNDDVVYYCIRGTHSDPDRLFKTRDGGHTWDTLTFDPTGPHIGSPSLGDFSHNRWISGLAVDPNNPDLLYVAYCGFDEVSPTIKKVTQISYNPKNQQYRWRLFNRGIPDIPVNCITIDQHTGRLFVGTDRGVYLRMPSDPAWTLYGTGLPHTMVMDLDVAESSGWIRAATYGRGVWEFDLGYGAKSYRKADEQHSLIEDIAPFEVYPNPFVNRFMLSFDLDEPAVIDVAVMDVSGNVFSRLQESQLMEVGSHELRIDLNDQPNGMYLLLLNINGETHAQKVYKNGY